MPSDFALAYDQAKRCCDLVFDGTDFVLDATPVTPVLVSLGTDRRANPDDKLPSPPGPFATPASLTARRGTPLDALDPAGQPMGSRLWLLRDKKQTEETRQLGEDYAAEALEGLEAELGLDIALGVTWAARNLLRVGVQVSGQTTTVYQAVGG